MIITKQWLQEWIDVSKLSTEDIADTLNAIGLEVDSIKKIRIPKNIVVGYVLSCEKHPNADKLNVCKVDIGDKIEQIVCGAKNVASGQMVAVAKIGAIMPDGLVIKEAKLRDVFSYGMICSSNELGLPKINDGIMVLDESIGELKLGKELCEYPLLNDDIIEIELTANRGDCLSVYGVARDISVPFKLDLQIPEAEEEDEHQLGIGRVLNVTSGDRVESSLVFKAMENREIKSNLLIDLRLAMIEESNNDDLQKFLIYSTYSTGVLLRAYRHDLFEVKEERANLYIKKQENGLDAVLGEKVVSYIGVFQEESSKAKADTPKIILEANYTHPNIILNNSFGKKFEKDRHFYRSTRGSEPDLNFGINFLLKILKDESDVMVYAGSQQVMQDSENAVINLNLEELKSIIGQEISKNRIIDILKRLGFDVQFKHEQEILNIKVPFFRHDILNKQDVCEEIVRIVGIDNIEATPYVFSEKSRLNDSYFEFKKRQMYRNKAVNNGFFETMHFVFDDRERNAKYGLETLLKKKELANPITSELNSFRSSLIPNILDSVSKNVNYGKKSVPLFEIGTVFNKKREESLKMALVYCGEIGNPNIQNHGKPATIDFYTFAKKITNIIGEFDIEKSKPKNLLCNPYEYARVIIEGKDIGFISKLHINVQKDFDIYDTYICELDFEKLIYEKVEVEPYSRFQALSRDLSLMVKKDIEYSKIKNSIEEIAPKELIDFKAIDVYESEEFGDKESLTVKFYFQSLEETLKDEKVSAIIDEILNTLKDKFGITIR